MHSHDILRGFCKDMCFILFATTVSNWSRNGNSEGFQMQGRPSKNTFLGRATSEYHARTRIETGARQGTLRSS